LASLPAKFSDGKPLDQTAYPWLLNSLVCRYFERLKKRSLFVYGKELITIFLAWYVVPLTMVGFWLRYIPRHDWVGTLIHIGLIAISIGFAFISYRLCGLTLQGKEETIFKLTKFWRDRRFYYDFAILVVVVFLFSLLSYGAINGQKPILKWSKVEKKSVPEIKGIRVIIPWAFDKLGYDVFANFREKDVSTKPTNYWEINEKDRIESVKGANFKSSNLNNANMYEAFLVKADFRDALIKDANFEKANLQKANLESLNLELAKLGGANLQEANLRNANLQQADLLLANLKKANLWKANLQDSKLEGANFQGANLKFASLRKARLWGVNLQDANLGSTNLQKSNFKDANLKNANLKHADLKNSYLFSTDLRGATNITIDQLSEVKTLHESKLDSELIEKVQNCCPHLLEIPID
jgi:uncharacterized protein YjbI with pentapeptide repeats